MNLTPNLLWQYLVFDKKQRFIDKNPKTLISFCNLEYL